MGWRKEREGWGKRRVRDCRETEKEKKKRRATRASCERRTRAGESAPVERKGWGGCIKVLKGIVGNYRDTKKIKSHSFCTMREAEARCGERSCGKAWKGVGDS